MCETNEVNVNEIVFLGSGRRNIVIGVSTSDPLKLGFPPFSRGFNRATLPHHIALRISDIPQKECNECLKALEQFVGPREIISLTSEMKACFSACVPPRHLELLRNATEALLLPNFTVDPAGLLGLRKDSFPLRGQGGVGIAANYTVELKPKSAWRRPRVIGIEVDGKAYFLHPVKRTHCRYAQMQCYKLLRNAPSEAHQAVREALAARPAAYCPNFFFRARQSTREGLRRLASSLSLSQPLPSPPPLALGGCPPSDFSIPFSLSSVSSRALDGVAAALDHCGLAPALAHLQIFGIPKQRETRRNRGEGDTTKTRENREMWNNPTEVLDVELLARWATAADPSSVRWLLDPNYPYGKKNQGEKEKSGEEDDEEGEEEELDECGCGRGVPLAGAESGAGLPPLAVPPSLDFATCCQRFYTAVTARDVSILIAVSEPTEDPCELGAFDSEAEGTRAVRCSPDSSGGVFVDYGFPKGALYRIGVVDLDDKTHKTLKHYSEYDASIVNAFSLVYHQF